jgi:hypothetical protein
MNIDKTIIIITTSSIVGGYCITKLIKHINKLIDDVNSFKHDVELMKNIISEYNNTFTAIDKTLEGIAYAIPFNSKREWQNKIIKKKIAYEMSKWNTSDSDDSDYDEMSSSLKNVASEISKINDMDVDT